MPLGLYIQLQSAACTASRRRNFWQKGTFRSPYCVPKVPRGVASYPRMRRSVRWNYWRGGTTGSQHRRRHGSSIFKSLSPSSPGADPGFFCRGGGGQRRPCIAGALGARADGGSRVHKHLIKVHSVHRIFRAILSFFL